MISTAPWLEKVKEELDFDFQPDFVAANHHGALHTAERRIFYMEKSADMRYNKLLNFAGVTGDCGELRFRERYAYERRKKT